MHKLYITISLFKDSTSIASSRTIIYSRHDTDRVIEFYNHLLGWIEKWKMKNCRKMRQDS